GDTPGGGGNNEETGETPEDYVWVFTYEVDNTKYHDSATAGNELAGAGFRLYDSTGNTEIGLIYDSTLSAYRPVKSGEAATEMTSAATTGKFDIKGLDAGTYVLKETTVPSGYNKCDDITITIGAVHEENTGGSTAKLTFSGSSATNNIVNNKGSALPSTGGMGTTLFVVGGGVTMAAAGIYLVSKKRSKDAE
ncbi:MAG: LPXTG cell wall anchor domain-containing protein, partial [Ruminococcus sp.]|nr:LPXTG cell wall anchor domain-containing protein [Ruminococcus sp.]